MDKLSTRVRQLREYTGLTQKDFAEKCGLEQGNINHLERDRARPLWENVEKIILAFPQVNTDWLLLGRGEMLKKLKGESLELAELRKENESLKKELSWAKGMIRILDKDNLLQADELLGKLHDKFRAAGRGPYPLSSLSR